MNLSIHSRPVVGSPEESYGGQHPQHHVYSEAQQQQLQQQQLQQQHTQQQHYQQYQPGQEYNQPQNHHHPYQQHHEQHEQHQQHQHQLQQHQQQQQQHQQKQQRAQPVQQQAVPRCTCPCSGGCYPTPPAPTPNCHIKQEPGSPTTPGCGYPSPPGGPTQRLQPPAPLGHPPAATDGAAVLLSSPHVMSSLIASKREDLTEGDLMDTSPPPVADRAAGGKGSSSVGRAHVLPPCKVCEAPATGFHYGVNTCEACKGFFRRSILRKEIYVCVKSIKCSIQKGKRNMCASCRYQRCLAAGMSKEGIKTGRYTYEKRTSDILELKRLHGQEARQRVQDRQEQLTQRFEQLIAQIVAAQERNHTDASQTNPIINEIHKSYLEKKKQEERERGGPLAVQATSALLEDKKKVMNGWIATAEIGLKQMVKFAKDLPGFNSLPLPDQIMLLKNSIAEAWVITRHKAFNVEVGCYSAHCGFTFDINKVFDAEMVEVLLTVVKRIQHLELTYEETCLLKAMSFFFSDRCELTAAQRVDEMQMELVEVLTYLLQKNHPDKPHMLAHILMVLTDLRSITELYHKHNEKVLSWTDMQRAPLIWEVMSYSRTVHHRSDDEDDDGTTDSAGSSDKPGEPKMVTEN